MMIYDDNLSKIVRILNFKTHKKATCCQRTVDVVGPILRIMEIIMESDLWKAPELTIFEFCTLKHFIVLLRKDFSSTRKISHLKFKKYCIPYL